MPDRLYPFATVIKGHLVRGKLSYESALTHAFDTYGPGRYGYKLMMYREIFHFVGAIIFITAAGFVSQVVFGSNVILYVLFCAAVLGLTFQEFYLQPLHNAQRTQKGVTDWVIWVAPMTAYMFMLTF
jgi:hypothetical protein